MKNLFILTMQFLLSILLWIIWWIIATFIIVLMVIISIVTPKVFWNKFVIFACKILLYSLLFFPKLKGEELNNLPYPVIYVANHVSFFDLFIAGSVLPGNPRGLEIGFHFRMPVYGWFIKRFGQIPIERGSVSSIRSAFKKAEIILKNRERSIYVAPEGTRTHDGMLRSFGGGAFFISRQTGVPIVPVVYKGLYEMCNRNNYLIIPGRFDVVVLPPIYPDKFKDTESMLQYTRDLMSDVLAKKD